MKLNEAIEAIEDVSSPDYFRSIDAAELTDWQDVAFTLYAANAELLEALESLLRCSEYKATGHCQDCVPAAHEAIRRHKGE